MKFSHLGPHLSKLLPRLNLCHVLNLLIIAAYVLLVLAKHTR
jgi:hypothetical protein